MIKLNKKQQIILKHRDGFSNREIAKDLGIDKNTVNKYVKEYEKYMAQLLDHPLGGDAENLPEIIMENPKYNTANRGPKPSTLKAKAIISECLKLNADKRRTGRSKQQMTKNDIYRYLVKKGIAISYSTVKNICQELESISRTEEAFIKQDYSPGQACEFDWGEVKLNINNEGYKKYQMAVFTSSYCNYRFAVLYRSQDTAAFQDAHVRFFKHCNGIYRKVVYDNMRVAVKRFVGPTEKEPTEALTKLSGYYGFDYRFCNVRRGNEKGHVERSVDVVRHFSFAEPDTDIYDSLEAANQYLLSKCIEKNALPLSDGRVPSELFKNEYKQLLPLIPDFTCFIKRVGCNIDKYSTITINNVHYSVPDKYVMKKLDARIYISKVVIYDGTSIVATHIRHYKHGEYILDIFHYLKTLKRKNGALSGSTALLQADTKIKNIYETYYTKEPKTFLEVLEIINDKGVDAVMVAINHVKSITPTNISAEKVRAVCDKKDDNNCIIKIGSDHLSRKSKETLKGYDALRDIQNQQLKEVM